MDSIFILGNRITGSEAPLLGLADKVAAELLQSGATKVTHYRRYALVGGEEQYPEILFVAQDPQGTIKADARSSVPLDGVRVAWQVGFKTLRSWPWQPGHAQPGPLGPFIELVGADYGKSEGEEDWNGWYNTKHVPEMFHLGAAQATRMIRLGEGHEIARYPKYLVVYAFADEVEVRSWYENPERAAVLADGMKKYADTGTRLRWRVFYEPLRVWSSSKSPA